MCFDAALCRIRKALWQGREPEEGALERVLALFRLTFRDSGEVLPEVGARPVWLILAITPDRILRMKPQNLVAGLPLRAGAKVS